MRAKQIVITFEQYGAANVQVEFFDPHFARQANLHLDPRLLGVLKDAAECVWNDLYKQEQLANLVANKTPNGQGQRGDDGLIVGDSAAP